MLLKSSKVSARRVLGIVATVLIVGCSDTTKKSDAAPDIAFDLQADLSQVDGPTTPKDRGVDRGPDAPTGPWSRVLGPLGLRLNAIWGNSPTNVYAVGAKGMVYHYDGSRWDLAPSRTREDLYDVIGFDDGVVVAVGEGTVLVYDGKDWEANLTLGSYRSSLRAVWGASSDEIFAVGKGGVIRRTLAPSSHWNDLYLGTTDRDLNAVFGFSERDVFVAGNDGTLLRYDYDKDKFFPLDTGSDKHLTGLWGRNKDDLYACGPAGHVLHFDGKDWGSVGPQGVDTNFSAIWGRGESLWVVGESSHAQKALYRRQAGNWHPDAPLGAYVLTGVWGTPQAGPVFLTAALSIWQHQI